MSRERQPYAIPDRLPAPPVDLLVGMDEKAKAKFVESWRASDWLTGPIRAALKSRRTSLVGSVIYDGLQDYQIKEKIAEIRVLDRFLGYLPYGE